MLRSALERLRKTLANRAERAYADRDTQGMTAPARAYAAGEAHAYGTAEQDVRDAQQDPRNKA